MTVLAQLLSNRNREARNRPGVDEGLSPALQGIADAFSQLSAPGSTAVAPKDQLERVANTPGYQFALDQGNKAIMGNASALGLRQAGVTAQDVGNFTAQGIAFPAFQDYMNRLTGLAGGAQTASTGLGNTVGQLGINNGQIQAQLAQNAGNAQAAGALGQAGQWQKAIGGIGSILGDIL